MRTAAAPFVLILVLLAASFLITDRPVSGAEVAENTWKTKASMHEARSGLGVAVVNGKIYAIGGWNSNYSSAGTNEMYNPATDSWTTKDPIPTPRSNFGIAVYQNKIYCFGGSTTKGATGANEVYDPETNTWKTKTPMPTASGYLDANVVDGRIYLIGATVNGILASKEVYDIATDTWSTGSVKTNFPLAFTSHASVVLDDKIYFIGVNKTQIYDPATDEWSYGAPIPWYFGGSVAATTGVFAPKRIYVMGGGSVLPYADNYVYNPEADVWDRGADMPTARGTLGVAVVNDVLYAIGGDSAWYFGVFGVNEQYTPFGYGTIPPVVDVVSPENQRYNVTSVLLDFTVNKAVSWIGYSLDGLDNVTVTGNVTLAGLSSGLHNVTVYAKDAFENEAVSEIVTFTIAVPEPFPVVPIAAGVAVVAVIIVAAGLLFYNRKRRKEAQQT